MSAARVRDYGREARNEFTSLMMMVAAVLVFTSDGAHWLGWVLLSMQALVAALAFVLYLQGRAS